jgi:hypothetical protein
MSLSDDSIQLLKLMKELIEAGKLDPAVLLPEITLPARGKRPIPDDFSVSNEMIFWFRNQGFTFDRAKATEQWMDAMRSNRSKYRYTDWESAWRNGMRNHAKWRKPEEETVDIQATVNQFFNREKENG